MLGAWSVSHRTSREVPRKISLLFNKIKAGGEWGEP